MTTNNIYLNNTLDPTINSVKPKNGTNLPFRYCDESLIASYAPFGCPKNT